MLWQGRSPTIMAVRPRRVSGLDERVSSSSLPVGTVTFLLTDVAGSTMQWEAAPDAIGPAIARHYELLDQVIAAHGGVRPVEQGEGDSVVGVFAGTSDAVAAALDAPRRHRRAAER